MEKMLKSWLFWLGALLITVVVFVAGINLSRTYRAEMNVLLVFKNTNTAENSQRILGDAKEIVRSLSFYNGLVVEGNLVPQNQSLTNAQLKNFWQKQIAVKVVRESDVLKISVFNADQTQAEKISRAVSHDLAVVLSKYYNLKTELGVRFIDGPIVYQEPRVNFPVLLFISLVLGLLLSIAIFFLNELWQERKFNHALPKENFFSLANLDRYKEGSVKFASRISKVPDFFSSADKIQEEPPVFQTMQETYVPGQVPMATPEKEITVEKPVASERKSSAPANLPIAPEGFPHDLFPSIKAEVKLEKNDLFEKPHEPTEGEVKDRLNKLLRGDL